MHNPTLYDDDSRSNNNNNTRTFREGRVGGRVQMRSAVLVSQRVLYNIIVVSCRVARQNNRGRLRLVEPGHRRRTTMYVYISYKHWR